MSTFDSAGSLDEVVSGAPQWKGQAELRLDPGVVYARQQFLQQQEHLRLLTQQNTDAFQKADEEVWYLQEAIDRQEDVKQCLNEQYQDIQRMQISLNAWGESLGYSEELESQSKQLGRTEDSAAGNPLLEWFRGTSTMVQPTLPKALPKFRGTVAQVGKSSASASKGGGKSGGVLSGGKKWLGARHVAGKQTTSASSNNSAGSSSTSVFTGKVPWRPRQEKSSRADDSTAEDYDESGGGKGDRDRPYNPFT